MFASLFLFLVGLASRLSTDPVRFAPPIVVIPGALLVVFGAGYPHFLEAYNWLGSTTWSITLIVAALAYGVVGVFILGVQLDYVLLAAALILLGAWRSSTSPPAIAAVGLRP